MNLDGAENAKCEVFRRSFKYTEQAAALSVDQATPIFVPDPDYEAQAAREKLRGNGDLRPKEMIAVGLLRPRGASPNGQDVKVGIFVQRKRLVDHPVVLDARRLLRGEAEVIVTGPVQRHGLNVRRGRPLRIGRSVGHHRVTAGTIGCFGRCRTSGRIGIVSNNHVLAHTNRGQVGDLVIQPGRWDCRPSFGPGNHVARLKDFVPIDFAPGAGNLVDCAFAVLDETVDCNDSTCDVISAGGAASADAWTLGTAQDLVVPGGTVKKVGRTTGFTTGIVEAVEVDNLTVQMEAGPRPRYAVFHQQIGIGGIDASFSKGGDSGALICTDRGQPVALLFAGTKSGGGHGHGITYANPIRTVLDALDVDIYVRT